MMLLEVRMACSWVADLQLRAGWLYCSPVSTSAPAIDMEKTPQSAQPVADGSSRIQRPAARRQTRPFTACPSEPGRPTTSQTVIPAMIDHRRATAAYATV